MGSQPRGNATIPAEVCGYPIERPLSDGDGPVSYLAIGPGGRGVVLKPLDSECLWQGGLHPSIKERLGRVRELALAGVANLSGVERDREANAGHDGGAWLIWEYVRGQDFWQYATAPGCTPRHLALAARELVLTVESLHQQGIVHGAIKSGNAIVGAGGSMRVTHVSPLLYTDPAEDARAVVALLQDVLQHRREGRTALGRIIAEANGDGDGGTALRQLGTRLASLAGQRGNPAVELARPEDEARPRRRTRLAALLVFLVGLAAAYGVWHAIGRPPLSIPEAIQPYVDAVRARGA